MQRFSIGRRLSQRWMLLVAVVVLAVAGFAVYRLHAIFASHDVVSTPRGNENDIVPFNPNGVVSNAAIRGRALHNFQGCTDRGDGNPG